MAKRLEVVRRFCKLGAILVFIVALWVGPLARADSDETAMGYKPLFDGQSLKGWTYIGKPGGEYFVSNGAIVCPSNTYGNLVTDGEYGDFSLRLEYKFESNGNNGVAIRAPFSTENLTYVGVEIQMLDDTAPMHRNLKPWQYNGSIYGIVPATNGAAKIGEWNTEEIECIGRNYRITLNGREIVHADLNDVNDLETLQAHPGMFRLRGRLGFLGHESHFEFRNIRIKELDKPEKDNTPPVGFRALFNGMDMSGWQTVGKTTIGDHWQATNGEITFDGHGEAICSSSNFQNIELLADWKIQSGGMGAVAIRNFFPVFIGDPGNTAKADQAHPAPGVSGLLPGNRPGPPLTNADKQVGEWNRLRIIVLGDKTHVFINGQLVQKSATIEDPSPTKGAIATNWPIELRGYLSKLWFKNVYIREIK